MSTKYIASNWRLPNKAGVDSYLNDNYGLTFDGSEYISNTHRINAISKYSFSVWFKMASAPAAYSFIYADANSSGQGASARAGIGFYQNFFFATMGNGSSVYSDQTSYNISSAYDNNWHHITLIVNGTSQKLYLDNSLVHTYTSSVSAGTAGTQDYTIGRYGDYNGHYFNGSISELAVFNYALSESQISTLYGSSSLGAGNPMALKPAPIAYYNLADNSSGNPLTQPNEAVEDASVFEFDRSSVEYVKIDGPALNFTDKMSFSAWAKFTSTAQDIYSVVSNFNPNSGLKYYLSYYRSNTGSGSLIRVQMYSANSNLQSFDVSVSQLDVNRWYHLAFSFDGTTNANGFNIYIDNVKHSFTANNAGINSNTSEPTKIGHYQNNNTYAMIGEISNVQFWDTNLLDSDIATLYNNGQPLLTGTQPQASNLKAWYKLDQSANWDVSGSGNWDVPDASGNGNDGTSSGMTSANLVLTDLTRNLPYDSYSFSFDAASSDYIDCGNPTELQITGDITISAWFKSTSSATGTLTILSKGYYGNGTISYALYLIGSSGGVGFDYYGGNTVGTRVYAQYTVAQNDGQWHHLVGVKSGSSSILYLDGSQVSTGVGTQAAIYNSSQDVIIGANSNNANYFDGEISNISIFNEALTSTEVMKLYSNGMPQDLSSFTPAPVAWWTLGSNSFFNGSNFICKDLIGSNDGTSVNAGVDALQGNTPRSEANGTGTNMDIPTNLEGTTKYSSNNSWSINMSESARVADTP